MLPCAQHLAKVLRHLLGQKEICMPVVRRPITPFLVHLPHTAPHDMVGVPMRIKTRSYLFDLCAIDLLLDLFRRIDQYIWTMDKYTWPHPTIWDALLTRLLAYSTTTQRA